MRNTEDIQWSCEKNAGIWKWQNTWFLDSLFCQTLGLVLRLRVDFVLPLSQEQQEQEEQEEEQEEQPLTKIYQKGVY